MDSFWKSVGMYPSTSPVNDAPLLSVNVVSGNDRSTQAICELKGVHMFTSVAVIPPPLAHPLTLVFWARDQRRHLSMENFQVRLELGYCFVWFSRRFSWFLALAQKVFDLLIHFFRDNYGQDETTWPWRHLPAPTQKLWVHEPSKEREFECFCAFIC